MIALVPLAALDQLTDGEVFRFEFGLVALYPIGVALLGLIDDLLAGRPRGWRGHGAAVLRGGFSTGALKAIGALGLALYVLSRFGYDDGEYLLAVALLVLTTNLFNLLDLRPGRSAKALRAARRRADARDLGRALRCGCSACSPRRCSSPASTTCASAPCWATPAPT